MTAAAYVPLAALVHREIERHSTRESVGDCFGGCATDDGVLPPQASTVTPGPVEPLAALSRFIVTDEQVQTMKATRMIWRDVIAESHVCVWAAPGNGGKTTLARLAAAEMAADGFKVLYFQEDASAGDLPALHQHAKEHGYILLNSTLARSVPEDQIAVLHDLAYAGSDLSNVVLIMDTLKKYADLMSKRGSRAFFQLMRALTQRGATVVLLGHTNKHRGPDGKLVFEGVGDVRNDVDEMIYIEATDKDANGLVLLTMRPDKVRCQVREITFELDTTTMAVDPLPKVVDVAELRRRTEQMEKDSEVIAAVQDVLRHGGMPKFKLISEVVAASGVGDRTVRAVVNRYMGSDPADQTALWLQTYFRTNNTLHVSLNPAASPALSR